MYVQKFLASGAKFNSETLNGAATFTDPKAFCRESHKCIHQLNWDIWTPTLTLLTRKNLVCESKCTYRTSIIMEALCINLLLLWNHNR
jgi:hypothetical protein